MHTNRGGPGSQEEQDALAYNGGVRRRNSIDQAQALHGANPTGPAGGTMTAADFEAMRTANASVPYQTLLSALPTNSEVHWDPNRGGGRAQIRTGRNFSVDDAGGGRPFEVRVHTNDNHRPLAENAGANAVLRVAQGNQTLLSAPIVAHSDARQIGKNWAGAKTKDNALINSAHIPLDLPPIPAPVPAPPPPPAAGYLPPVVGRAASNIGGFLWDASGGSHLVGGTQQVYRNMQAGGTWSGVAVGTLRAAAGATMLTSLTAITPLRAASAVVMGGATAAGRRFGLWS